MPKRAERRHHEERIKAKFKRVVRRWWSGLWPKDASYMRWVEDTAAKRAHHNKCDCWMCRQDRYDRQREKVLDKTYIKEGLDE